MSNADVLVVGCGPVGAYAAWRMAQAGLRVIALEAQDERAAGAIGAFHFEHAAFERTGVPPPPESDVICRFPGVTVHAPDPRMFVAVRGVETWALDLDRFVAMLRKLALNAGAELRYGVRVKGPLLEGNRVVGATAEHDGQANALRAALVVDCSGLGRAVRRSMPLLDFPGADRRFAVYMEYWRDPQPEPLPGLHSYGGDNAWTARYPDYLIAGMGGPHPLDRVQRLHAQWVERMLPGSRTVERRVSGYVPYAHSPATFVDHGLLVLGDAAATNKPFSGEGIASGMILARIAAEELPAALRSGASRAALWPINRRYYADQGVKFAFLRQMGLALLELPRQDLNVAFEIGLSDAESFRQTFLDYEVRKPLGQWLGPLARLALRPATARRYIAALTRASAVARQLRNYPSEENFEAWQRKFLRLVG